MPQDFLLGTHVNAEDWYDAVVDEISGESSRWPVGACPRCDYSLQGLPPVGICPECGRAYDDQHIFLYGEAAGSRRNAWNITTMTKRHVVFRVLLLVVACIPFLLDWRHGSPGIRLFNIAICAFPFAVICMRSRINQGSGVVQVMLGPEGVRQGTRGFGPIPYERVDRAQIFPWPCVRLVDFRELKDGKLQVRITSAERWWKYDRAYVNAVVKCDAMDILQLKRRITRWKAETGSSFHI